MTVSKSTYLTTISISNISGQRHEGVGKALEDVSKNIQLATPDAVIIASSPIPDHASVIDLQGHLGYEIYGATGRICYNEIIPSFSSINQEPPVRRRSVLLVQLETAKIATIVLGVKWESSQSNDAWYAINSLTGEVSRMRRQ